MHSRYKHHNFPFLFLACTLLIHVIWQSGIYTSPSLHYSHTTSSLLPFSHTGLTLTSSSLFPRRPFPRACNIFFGLKSNKKVMEASSALYFWDHMHHTPIHDEIVAKTTEALALHCTRIFIVVISKPCAEA